MLIRFWWLDMAKYFNSSKRFYIKNISWRSELKNKFRLDDGPSMDENGA